MAEQFDVAEQLAIPLVLSTPRFATYLAAKNQNVLHALQLYHWNAQACAALLFPLHVFEICIRNAVANAAESAYLTADWPWSKAFERSLPKGYARHFSPHRELTSTRDWMARPQQTTGKVIADLKFAFWVSMYTGRHDGRLWRPYIAREYPHFPRGTAPKVARLKIHDTANSVRELRNRIAHHEPIYMRDLRAEYAAIEEIIGYKCPHTFAWMRRSQMVTGLLAAKP